MDNAADDFRKTVASSNTYAKRKDIIKELDDLKKDYDNTLLSKIGGAKIMQEISKKVSELDTIYKTILDSMSSRSIAEYRKFCEDHHLSNLVELDMSSEKMKVLRSEYTEENKILRNKYLITGGNYGLNEEINSRKDAQAKKQEKLNVLEESLYEINSAPSNFGEKLMQMFLED